MTSKITMYINNRNSLIVWCCLTLSLLRFLRLAFLVIYIIIHVRASSQHFNESNTWRRKPFKTGDAREGTPYIYVTSSQKTRLMEGQREQALIRHRAFWACSFCHIWASAQISICRKTPFCTVYKQYMSRVFQDDVTYDK